MNTMFLSVVLVAVLGASAGDLEEAMPVPLVTVPSPFGKLRGHKRHDAAERMLQTGTCNVRSITVVQPPTWKNYLTCIRSKLFHPSYTGNIVGEQVRLMAECWCQHDVTTLIAQYNCTKNYEFNAFSQMECNPDCSSAQAQTCVQECPPLCLVRDYAPKSCLCDSCAPYILCIADAGENMTISSLPKPRSCNEHNFEADASTTAYQKCVSTGPVRTDWQRFTSQYHCACQVNLSAAIDKYHCCNAQWAGDFCSSPCLSAVNCSLPAAVQCQETCTNLCGVLLPYQVTQACSEHCYTPGNPCYKYRTCKPPPSPALGYVCDDGTPPSDNGCCSIKRNGQAEIGCPTLCRNRAAYSLPWGIQCSCFSCPANVTQASVVANISVLSAEQLVVSGQATIANIMNMAGLTVPTQQMVTLMAERNAQILAVTSAANGVYTTKLQEDIDTIAEEYNNKILQAAQQAAACRNNPSSCPTTTTVTPAPIVITGSSSDNSSVGIIVGVVVGGAVLITIIGAAVVCYVRHPKRRHLNPNAMVEQSADSTVVVGRPVPSNAASGQLARGAPVNYETGADKNAVVVQEY